MKKNNQLDLNSLTQSGKYKVKIESVDEENEDDAFLRRKKDWYLFITMIVTLLLVFGVCTALVFSSTSGLSTTALNGMIGLAFALAGYYVGGKNK